MGKTLLIISGGIEAVPGIQLAKEMGLYVVVSDRSPDAPGFEHADDSIIACTYDVDETVQKAKHYHETVRKFEKFFTAIHSSHEIGWSSGSYILSLIRRSHS